MLELEDDVIAVSYRAWELVVKQIAASHRTGQPFSTGFRQRRLVRRYEVFQGQGHAECTVLFSDASTRYYVAEFR